MPIGNRARLLAVTAREFQQIVAEAPKTPALRSFKPMRQTQKAASQAGGLFRNL